MRRKAREGGNLRDHALLELLAATGLHAAEAAGLTLGDLALGERSGRVTVRFGKGRKRRRVPIHLRARKALSAYLEQEQLADPAARAVRAGDPLFRSRAGEPLTPYALWCTVKKYARLAEVEGVTPHTFRHSVATPPGARSAGGLGDRGDLPGAQPVGYDRALLAAQRG